MSHVEAPFADRRQRSGVPPGLDSRNQTHGFRILAERAGSRVQFVSRNGHDLTDRFNRLEPAAFRVRMALGVRFGFPYVELAARYELLH